MSTRLATILALAAAVAITGCSPPGETPTDGSPSAGDTQPAPSTETGPPLQILCGGSFRPPMERLAELFEQQSGHSVELVFGQSEDHLPHVKLKAAGDVFVSHDPYMEYTEQADALTRYVAVGFVAPVLVTAKGNPMQVNTVDDLAREGLRVVLPNPDFSTCGEMVAALLEKKGIADAVSANVGNALVRSHSEVASMIKLGSRDAGIMWNGVAHNWLDDIEIVAGEYEYDEEIRVGVMGLSYSRQPEVVEELLKFVEEHGTDVFAEFGYVK